MFSFATVSVHIRFTLILHTWLLGELGVQGLAIIKNLEVVKKRWRWGSGWDSEELQGLNLFCITLKTIEMSPLAKGLSEVGRITYYLHTYHNKHSLSSWLHKQKFPWGKRIDITSQDWTAFATTELPIFHKKKKKKIVYLMPWYCSWRP